MMMKCLELLKVSSDAFRDLDGYFHSIFFNIVRYFFLLSILKNRKTLKFSLENSQKSFTMLHHFQHDLNLEQKLRSYANLIRKSSS